MSTKEQLKDVELLMTRIGSKQGRHRAALEQLETRMNEAKAEQHRLKNLLELEEKVVSYKDADIHTLYSLCMDPSLWEPGMRVQAVSELDSATDIQDGNVYTLFSIRTTVGAGVRIQFYDDSGYPRSRNAINYKLVWQDLV